MITWLKPRKLEDRLASGQVRLETAIDSSAAHTQQTTDCGLHLDPSDYAVKEVISAESFRQTGFVTEWQVSNEVPGPKRQSGIEDAVVAPCDKHTRRVPTLSKSGLC